MEILNIQKKIKKIGNFKKMVWLIGVVWPVRVVWLVGVVRLVGVVWPVGVVWLVGEVWLVKVKCPKNNNKSVHKVTPDQHGW